MTGKKLHNAEQLFLALVEHTSDIIVAMNREGIITYINPAVAKVLGFKDKEMIGAKGFELVHPDDMKFLTDSFNVLAMDANAPVIRGEMRLHHKNGSWLAFETVGSNLVRDNFVESIILNYRDITERKQAEAKQQQTLDSLKKEVGVAIQVLVSALEARNPYMAGHQSRVNNLACAIATEMRLTPEKIEGIHMASFFHDIGELSIPAEILSKTAKLTDSEYDLVKKHSQSGYEMLKNVESPWPLAEIVYQHHERMNGSGYPRHLKGDEILLEARILAVADVVEAMSSHRPYRVALSMEVVLDEIKKNKGILYDNAVVDACLKLFLGKDYQLSK